MGEIEKRRQELKKSSNLHKKAIDDSFQNLASQAEQTATDVIIVGGVLLTALAIYKLLARNKTKPKKESQTPNRLLSVAKQQVGLYILNESRSKIQKYIDSLDESRS